MNVTAKQLKRINKNSHRHGYNQVIRKGYVIAGDGWSLDPVIIHEHIAGMPAAPHMRCFVKKDEEIVGLLDVSFSMLDKTRRECVKLGLARAEDVGLGGAR